jgi:hypothetical protein
LRVCFGTTAEYLPLKRRGGRYVRCGDARIVQRDRAEQGLALRSRWNTTAMGFTKPQAARHASRAAGASVQKPSSSSCFEGGNRPQRLGGAGTRHRTPFRACRLAPVTR